MATHKQLARAHGEDYIALDRGGVAGVRAALHRSRHRAVPALARRGAPRGGRAGARDRPRRQGRVHHRVLRGAPAGPPRRAAPRDGVLPVQQRRRRRAARAGGARHRARRRRRLRRPPRQRHRGHLRGRRARADGLDVPAPAVPVLGHRERRVQHGQRPARRRQRQRRASAPRSPTAGCRRSKRTARRSSTSRPASTRIARIRSPACKLTEADYAWVTRELIGVARRHSNGRIVSALEGGYALSALGRSVAEHVRELLAA